MHQQNAKHDMMKNAWQASAAKRAARLVVSPLDIPPRHTSNTERTGEEKVFQLNTWILFLAHRNLLR
jgi:hypothetical protein